MKNENIDNLFKELVIVGIIFMSICFGLQNLQHNQELNRLHKLIEAEKKEKIEAMKVAIDINNTLEIHREMNLSLNVKIDSLMNELNENKELDKLKKELR